MKTGLDLYEELSDSSGDHHSSATLSLTKMMADELRLIQVFCHSYHRNRNILLRLRQENGLLHKYAVSLCVNLVNVPGDLLPHRKLNKLLVMCRVGHVWSAPAYLVSTLFTYFLHCCLDSNSPLPKVQSSHEDALNCALNNVSCD